MSYASDLGLEVGSKIMVLNNEEGEFFKTGDIVTLIEDDDSSLPWFRGAGYDRKPMDLEIVKWEHCKEEKDMTSAIKIRFPCCVPMSEIKDQETFDKIFALFIANGAEKYETDWEDSKDYGYNYFGVDYYEDTIFYCYVKSYSFNDEEDEVTTYSVAELLGLVPEEEVSVTPVATTAQVIALLPVGTEVQIAKGSEWYYGDEFSSNPKDIKGTIVSNTRSHDTDGFVYYVKWSNGSANSYKLRDLVLWNGGSEAPVPVGTKLDVQYGDGVISTNIGNQDNSQGSGTGADIVAYRLHTPSVASQEAITERLEDKPNVGIDYSVMGTTASTEPLITITQEVKYTVSIKGITFTFTQEEIDGLAEELLGFTTL